MRDIKFRAWFYDGEDLSTGEMVSLETAISENYVEASSVDLCPTDECTILMQYTGLKDKSGVEIYFDDVLRFADKWEWYRGKYGIKMMFAEGERLKELQSQYDAEPYEERVVSNIDDYEWLLSSEIQSYWEVIGNIHENPELLNNA